jgi:uncharacterized OsmC-like protein
MTTCESHTISGVFKQLKIPFEKLEVELNGEYSMAGFVGETNNIYRLVNIETRIQNLEQAIDDDENLCPILYTLKLAGIKIIILSRFCKYE